MPKGKRGGRGRQGNAQSQKDLNSLAGYMKQNYNINVDTKSFEKMDFRAVAAGAQAIEDVIKEFPKAAPYFSELKGRDGGVGTANASLSGGITMRQSDFLDYEKTKATWDTLTTGSDFHPWGTGADDILSHEAGHILEAAMVKMRAAAKYPDPQDSFWRRAQEIEMWNKSKVATGIVSEAAKSVKKTEYGKGHKNDELIRALSRYAAQNRSETVAEAVSDYRRNGSKANPLSQEIWKILKRELG